jgi:hypothetical protein
MEDNFKIIHESKSNISYGYVVPKDSPTTVRYLSNLRDYNDTEADIHKQIRVSNQIYRWEGVVSTVVDVLADFAVSDMKVKGLKTKAKKIIDEWLKTLNKAAENIATGEYAFNSQCAIEFFLSGNGFIYKNWQKVKMESGVYQIPSEMLLINPLNIDIPKEFVSLGTKIIKFKPPKEVVELIQATDRTEEQKLIFNSMPEFIRKGLKDSDELVMTSDVLSHIKRKGRNYIPWGTPYLTRVFKSVAHKRKLQILDEVTTEGIINRITIFKIGDPENQETWGPDRLRAFHSLLMNPSPTLALVWAYDVSVEDVMPDPEVLNFENKYNQANSDILMSLGIPMSILTGDAKGDQYTAIAALLERLFDFRNEMSAFMSSVIEEILEKNGLKNEKFKITWKHSRLRNEKELRELVLSLYDRGLLGKETSVEEAGQDFDEQVDMIKREKSAGINEIMTPPELPFSGKNPIKSQKPISKTENTGKKPITDTTTEKTKTTLKLVKSDAGMIGKIYMEIANSIFKDLDKIDDKNRVLMRSMSLPAITQKFINNMFKVESRNSGITINQILKTRTENKISKFVDKMLSFPEKRNGRYLMKREFKTFASDMAELIEGCIEFEIDE